MITYIDGGTYICSLERDDSGMLASATTAPKPDCWDFSLELNVNQTDDVCVLYFNSDDDPECEYSFHGGGPTAEGYSYTGDCLTLRDGFIIWDTATRASDCDGRMDTGATLRAPIPATEGRYTPVWELLDSDQRDYSAEKAGY